MATTEAKPQMSLGKRMWLMVAPDAKKDEDGRDNFNSRAQFVLCAMGGAVGLGNLLRFPSVIYNNYGLQFFIPYLVALFLIGIPILILQIVVGQAYRAGCVTAWNNLNHRAKGIGFAEVFNGTAVVGYYVPILAWAMTYFRLSFQSPLPWSGQNTQDFFFDSVVRNVAYNGDLSEGMVSYPSAGMVGETVGWAFFTWFLTWMCMFKGVGLTGRVIYITMALPLIMILILAIRSLSLPDASDGFRLYVGLWRSESLAGPQVWQDAFGQMFFSIGVGFGYFTSYASYSSKYSNAVQDAFIIALSNSAIEIISALAVMGVVGYLGIAPGETRLSTFSSGFFYYPEALANMPAANFWSALFFATLFILGLTCVFALFEVWVTMVTDTDWGKKFPRPIVATILAIISFCISLLYCSEIGFNFLDAVDMFVNDVALFYTVFCEIVFATTLYRWRDPVDQIGFISYAVFNGGYLGSQIIGWILGHTVSPNVGAGVGFGIFIITTIASVLLGKTPTVAAPGFFAKSPLLARFWYAAFYSGNQLRRDINRAIMVPGNWKLPWAWPVILKYLTAPSVGLVLTFAYPKFIEDPDHMYNNPPFMYSFIIMHLAVGFVIIGFILPRFFNIVVPSSRRGEGVYEVMPRVTIGEPIVLSSGGIEGGSLDRGDSHDTEDITGSGQVAEK